jgi:hypothetical protein
MSTVSERPETLPLQIKCHCTPKPLLTLSIPRSALPLKSAVCQCDSCRRATGQLFASFAVVPGPAPVLLTHRGEFEGGGEGGSLSQGLGEEGVAGGLSREGEVEEGGLGFGMITMGNLDKLSCYASSSRLERWFCGRCGASVLNIEYDDDLLESGDGGGGGGEGRREKARKRTRVKEWEVATGTMDWGDSGPSGEEGGEDEKLNRALLWTADTRDGGIASWLYSVGSADGVFGAGVFMRGRDSERVRPETLQEMMARARKDVGCYNTEGGRDVGDEAALNGRDIEQTGERVLRASCHCKASQLEVRPLVLSDDPRNMSAELCACTSCRATSGFEVMAWTHIARHKICAAAAAGGGAVAEAMKNMGHYESSEGTHRYFCRTCGAKVFYDRAGLDRLDVALGLFEAAEGSRAEDWFMWNPDCEDVSYLSDAVDRGFVGRLADAVGAATRGVGKERNET